MAEKIATVDLKPGMIVTSQRTSSYVYSLGTDLSDARKFPMKGKAMVLREPTKVRLRKKKISYDPASRSYVTSKGSFITRQMVLMSHYKHGIVMYLAATALDTKWRLIKEKKEKTE